MIPTKLDLLVWRGTSFELELVSQVKKYAFDPAIHNGPADLKRTHAENLEYYGYVWEYVDFNSLYTAASLIVLRPWDQCPDEQRTPLLSLSKLNGDIEFTSESIKIGMAASVTEIITFDKGSYKLLLTTSAGKVDGLIYGTMNVKGEKG